MQYRSATQESTRKLKQLVILNWVSIETYENPLEPPLTITLSLSCALFVIGYGGIFRRSQSRGYNKAVEELGYSSLRPHAVRSLNWASAASPTLDCSIVISRDIYTKYSTLRSGISVYIVLKVETFPEAGGRGKYSLLRIQYMPIFHKEGFSIFSLLHRIFSTRNYCIYCDVPIDHAQYQGWNFGVKHRNIFHPYEPI